MLHLLALGCAPESSSIEKNTYANEPMDVGTWSAADADTGLMRVTRDGSYQFSEAGLTGTVTAWAFSPGDMHEYCRMSFEVVGVPVSPNACESCAFAFELTATPGPTTGDECAGAAALLTGAPDHPIRLAFASDWEEPGYDYWYSYPDALLVGVDGTYLRVADATWDVDQWQASYERTQQYLYTYPYGP